MDKGIKKTLFLFVGIIIVLAGLFGMSKFFISNQTAAVIDSIVDESTTITITEATFDGKLYTYKGTVSVPTPCHDLSAEAFIKESYPEQVELRFAIAEPGDDEICAQVITDKEFTIIFQASESAIIKATLNGEEVALNILEFYDMTAPEEVKG